MKYSMFCTYFGINQVSLLSSDFGEKFFRQNLNQFQSELFRFRINDLWSIHFGNFCIPLFSFYSFYGTLLGIPHRPGEVECAGVC